MSFFSEANKSKFRKERNCDGDDGFGFDPPDSVQDQLDSYLPSNRLGTCFRTNNEPQQHNQMHHNRSGLDVAVTEHNIPDVIIENDFSDNQEQNFSSEKV